MSSLSGKAPPSLHLYVTGRLAGRKKSWCSNDGSMSWKEDIITAIRAVTHPEKTFLRRGIKRYYVNEGGGQAEPGASFHRERGQ